MQKIILRIFYLILRKNLHEAENLFDIFTSYAKTSMALVPSQYIKIWWKV